MLYVQCNASSSSSSLTNKMCCARFSPSLFFSLCSSSCMFSLKLVGCGVKRFVAAMMEFFVLSVFSLFLLLSFLFQVADCVRPLLSFLLLLLLLLLLGVLWLFLLEIGLAVAGLPLLNFLLPVSGRWHNITTGRSLVSLSGIGLPCELPLVFYGCVCI